MSNLTCEDVRLNKQGRFARVDARAKLKGIVGQISGLWCQVTWEDGYIFWEHQDHLEKA